MEIKIIRKKGQRKKWRTAHWNPKSWQSFTRRKKARVNRPLNLHGPADETRKLKEGVKLNKWKTHLPPQECSIKQTSWSITLPNTVCFNKHSHNKVSLYNTNYTSANHRLLLRPFFKYSQTLNSTRNIHDLFHKKRNSKHVRFRIRLDGWLPCPHEKFTVVKAQDRLNAKSTRSKWAKQIPSESKQSLLNFRRWTWMLFGRTFLSLLEIFRGIHQNVHHPNTKWISGNFQSERRSEFLKTSIGQGIGQDIGFTASPFSMASQSNPIVMVSIFNQNDYYRKPGTESTQVNASTVSLPTLLAHGRMRCVEPPKNLSSVLILRTANRSATALLQPAIGPWKALVANLEAEPTSSRRLAPVASNQPWRCRGESCAAFPSSKRITSAQQVQAPSMWTIYQRSQPRTAQSNYRSDPKSSQPWNS